MRKRYRISRQAVGVPFGVLNNSRFLIEGNIRLGPRTKLDRLAKMCFYRRDFALGLHRIPELWRERRKQYASMS